MKRKRKIRWHSVGVLGIIILFLLSLIFPILHTFTKIGAVCIYVGVSYMQLKELRASSQDITNLFLFSLFMAALLIILLFFL